MDLSLTETLQLVYAVPIGLSFGTLFNVVADRLPQGMSIVFPASHCPTFKHPISLRDNIPVFSYLWLRGKCRYCSAAIPVRVPIVEAGTAVLFAIVVAGFDMSVEAVVILTSIGIFLVIGIIDFDTRLIPNVLVGPGLLIALALFPFGPGSELGIGEAYIRTAVGALSGFGMLLTVYLVAQFMGSAIGDWYLGLYT
ncbi:MAG: prepilin peptidase [SAR202 cluster bacterium]|nr:prepilin peptidase [SAR202 cluster bacterium]